MKIAAALMVAMTMALAGCAAEADEESVDTDAEEAEQAEAMPTVDPSAGSVAPKQVARKSPRSNSGNCNTCR